MQRGSSHLYTAFIDFKQAYDSIPRDKLWDHLNYCQMPLHLVSILQSLYHADEYTVVLDGDKRECTTIFWFQTEVPPLPPTIFNLSSTAG